MFDHDDHHRRLEDLERKVKRIEREISQMPTDAEVLQQILTELEEIKNGLVQIGSDVVTAETNLQAELNTLATANPDLDLSGLQTAVPALLEAIAPLEDHVTALGALKPVSAALPEYVHTGSSEINAEFWTLTGLETVPAEGGTAELLYHFSKDTPGAAPTGAEEGAWAVWTGATQAVPAA